MVDEDDNERNDTRGNALLNVCTWLYIPYFGMYVGAIFQCKNKHDNGNKGILRLRSLIQGE
jgi:hypothetical protein